AIQECGIMLGSAAPDDLEPGVFKPWRPELAARDRHVLQRQVPALEETDQVACAQHQHAIGQVHYPSSSIRGGCRSAPIEARVIAITDRSSVSPWAAPKSSSVRQANLRLSCGR